MTNGQIRCSRQWLQLSSAALMFAAMLFQVRVARADVAPPDSCTMPGQPCGSEDGCACRQATCSRRVPCSLCGVTVSCPDVGGRGGQSAEDPDDAGSNQGGSTSLCTSVYSCNRCRSDTGASCLTVDGGVAGAGTGGAGSGGHSEEAGDSGAAGESDGGSGKPSGHTGKHHGCSAVVDDKDVAPLLGLSVVLGLWASRRRRRS